MNFKGPNKWILLPLDGAMLAVSRLCAKLTNQPLAPAMNLLQEYWRFIETSDPQQENK